MDPIRELTYQFFGLPFEVRMRIARKLDLTEAYDDGLSETELFIRMFLRVWERGLFNTLQEEVRAAYSMLKETLNIVHQASIDHKCTVEVLDRWAKLARQFQITGADLGKECRKLGHVAAHVNSDIDQVYANYVQLYQSICAQVDAINEEISRIDPAV